MALMNWLLGRKDRRPSACRVGARAMVLAALHYRAEIERFREARAYGFDELERNRLEVLNWIKASRLKSEMEREELEFLKTPVGQSSSRTVIDAHWRVEGLGVLLWAFGRFELPPYDVHSASESLLERVGFLLPDWEKDLRHAGTLRADAEIQRFDSSITIVSWRLKQFLIGRDTPLFQQATETFGRGRSGVGEAMDFVGLLRAYPNFKEWWFDDLRIIEDDLAIGDKPIAEASPDEVKNCRSIVVERQIATYWLEGDHKLCSNVSPDTFLSAC